MDTLAFGYILPTTGRIRDLHPLETCAAGRTQKRTFSKEIKSSKNVLFINHELVQFCACWNMVIYHQQIQLLFSVLLAYSA